MKPRLKPRITRYGPIWCCAMLTGPAGFGDTPALAFSDWACRWVLFFPGSKVRPA